LKFESALEVLQKAHVLVSNRRNGEFSAITPPLPTRTATSFPIQFLSLFVSSGHMEEAFLNADMQVGLWVGFQPCPKWPTCPAMDVRDEDVRRLIWSFVIVYEPEWIHSGFPCTFWSPLSRRCNKRSAAEEQHLRLLHLLFVRFTEQVLWWQCKRGAMASYENGHNNASQKLDLIEHLVRRACMKQFVTAACAWGALDAETGKPILEMMDFKANWDCSLICKECACPGGKSKGAHKQWTRAHKMKLKGARTHIHEDCLGVARSYEPRLCEAFARAVRDKQIRRTFTASHG